MTLAIRRDGSVWTAPEDIVERLRREGRVYTHMEAAAEIERMRAILRNIAALKRSMGDDLGDAVAYAKKGLGT